MGRSEGMPASYLDMAFAVIFVFLAVILISTPEKPKKANDPAIMPKAEFIVELSWSDGSQDDLDLYVRTPDGKIVFFANRQTPIAFLDVDNVGRNNSVTLPDGTTQEVKSRVETITIRAIVPGTYTVNVHAYRKSSDPSFIDHAKVKITKLNPYSVVTETTADFDTQAQERTLANFVVEPDGSVSSVYASESKMVGAARR